MSHALKFDRTGPPADVLQWMPHTCPPPAHGQVKVRMEASPINPSDEAFIRGQYGTAPVLPQIPGFEGVGRVVASGGGFKGRLFTGKRVAVLNAAGGNWASETVVPASQVIPLSPRLSTEQAATFFVNPATALLLTRDVLPLKPGDWLLQTAAGSCLGQMVVRLGQRFGFRTLSVVRSEHHVAPLRQLGGDRVVVFNAAHDPAQRLQSLVTEATGGEPVLYAMDPVGGPTGSAVLSCLGRGSRFVAFGTLSDEPLSFSGRQLMTQQTTMQGFWLGHHMATRSLPFKLKLIRQLTRLVLDGTLATTIHDSIGLKDVPAACAAKDHATGPSSAGRTLIRMATNSG